MTGQPRATPAGPSAGADTDRIVFIGTATTLTWAGRGSPGSYTPFKSPLSDFRRAAEAAGLPTEVHYLRHGDSYRLGLEA